MFIQIMRLLENIQDKFQQQDLKLMLPGSLAASQLTSTIHSLAGSHHEMELPPQKHIHTESSMWSPQYAAVSWFFVQAMFVHFVSQTYRSSWLLKVMIHIFLRAKATMWPSHWTFMAVKLSGFTQFLLKLEKSLVCRMQRDNSNLPSVFLDRFQFSWNL